MSEHQWEHVDTVVISWAVIAVHAPEHAKYARVMWTVAAAESSGMRLRHLWGEGCACGPPALGGTAVW
eukprot:2845947-Prymnesium_polylepis.2